MSTYRDKFGTLHVDSDAAPDYSVPLWAQDARINRGTGLVDRYVAPPELHCEHVYAWHQHQDEQARIENDLYHDDAPFEEMTEWQA